MLDPDRIEANAGKLRAQWALYLASECIGEQRRWRMAYTYRRFVLWSESHGHKQARFSEFRQLWVAPR